MPRPGHIRLSEAISRYIASRRGRLSDSTIRTDTEVLSRLLDDLGDLYLDSIRPDHIEGWLAALLDTHITRDGITRPALGAYAYNNTRQPVAGLSAYLMSRGMIRTDWLVHSPRMRVTKTAHRQVSREVLWSMLDVTEEPRDRALLATAINTACRASEITRLKVGDVDLEAGTLSLYISKSRLHDEMAISEHLAGELATWLANYRRQVLAEHGRVLSPSDYLFCGRTKCRIATRYRDEDGVMRNVLTPPGYDPTVALPMPHKIVQQALVGVGLPSRGEGIHSIRRSVARLLFDDLVAGGYDRALRTVSAMLHHSNASITEGYLGLTSEVRQRDSHLRTTGILGPRPATDAKVIGLH